MADTIHIFEKKGLGKAPFVVTGYEHRVGPISMPGPATGFTLMVGYPGQPMGTCQYCGTPIAHCFWISSSDGKAFYVGSECVKKAGEASSIKIVDKKMREVKAKQRREAAERRFERDGVIIDRAINLFGGIWAEMEHPLPWKREQGESYLDYVKWMRRHSGMKGHRQMAKRFVNAHPKLAEEIQ